jgi:SAM-dependent methyltransferase
MRHALTMAIVVFLACVSQAQAPTEPTQQQKFWNDEYAHRAARGEKFSPNEFLVKVVDGKKPGTALDMSMGQGRNAIMLAERGWEVTGFDISDVAINEADGAKFDLGVERWDLIASIYAGPSRIDDVLRSLKPGGILVVEAFHRDSFGGGFRNNELLRLFENLATVIYYEDGVGRPDMSWSSPDKDFRFVRLVARKDISK